MTESKAPFKAASLTPLQLYQWRMAKGISRDKAAEFLDATTPQYTSWERGEVRIPQWIEKRLYE